MEKRKRVLCIIVAFAVNFLSSLLLPYVYEMIALVPISNSIFVVCKLILSYYLIWYPIIAIVAMFMIFDVKKRPLGKSVVISSFLNVGIVIVGVYAARLAMFIVPFLRLFA